MGNERLQKLMKMISKLNELARIATDWKNNQLEKPKNTDTKPNTETKYFNEAHKKNSELAMKTIIDSKKSPMSLKEALKQQERNSKDR